MATNDDLYLPRPVGTVTANFEQIQDVYIESRKTSSPPQAFEAAIGSLGSDQATDVFSFLSGEQDGIYGTGQGRQLYETLTGHLENLWQQLAPMLDGMTASDLATILQRDLAAQHPRDMVAAAEYLAGSPHWKTMYRTACDEADQNVQATMLHVAVAHLSPIAQNAATGWGRKTRWNQATAVLKRMRKKAQRYPYEPDAQNQVLWCGALLGVVEPQAR